MTTVVNLRDEPYDVFIGRGSPFGNPYTHLAIAKTLAKYQVATREESIDQYRAWFLLKLRDQDFRTQVKALNGKRLGCFCKRTDKEVPCHGDVIKEYLDNLKDSDLTSIQVRDII